MTPQDAVENCRTLNQTPQGSRIRCRLVCPMTAGCHRTLPVLLRGAFDAGLYIGPLYVASFSLKA